MSYEPRQFGARCDQCPLNGCSVVVPPETRAMASIAVVGDYPGLDDIRNERPFTGAAGGEFDQAIGQAGLDRRNLHITNALLCRPPDGKLENVIAKVQKENRKIVKENAQRAKNGETQLPMKLFPADCCRPRLMAEIRGFDKLLLVGGLAVKSALGLGASISDLRGGMIDGWVVETRDDRGMVSVRTLNRDDVPQVPGGARPVRAMPTLHPSFVMRARRWTHVFRSDLGRAARWWAGALGWTPPKITYHPDPETLRRFLARPEPYFAYDLETDGIEALTAKIRCVGIGTAEEVMIVGLLGKDGYTKFYPSSDEIRVRAILRDFFLNDAITKVGHNAGSYDRMVMESQEGYTPTPVLDTILLHRLSGESELPHNLGFVGSMYTDAPSWKTDREGNKLAWGAESDEQLHEYCAKDVAITAQVVPPLFRNVSLRSQDHLIADDHAIQSICTEMHTIGMPVDQEERGKKERKIHSEVYQLRDKLQTIAGNTSFNPGSNQQLQDLFFERWKLEPPCDAKDRYTGNGDPSTSDTVIRSLLTLPLHETHKEFLITLRNYRSAQKALGTYIVKLRTSDQYAEEGWDADETSEEREARFRYGEKKVGIVDPRTGRMHPGYNAHVTTSGRLSSSKPINAQNFPAWLRTLVSAPTGHIFVGADADQLELRIAASRWGASLYLRAFDAGADPHASTALAVFGKEFREADGFPGGKWDADLFVLDGTGKWGGHAKKLRNLAKRVQYASQYAASVETVHRVLTETENDAGELIYLHLSMREVRQMHNNWLANAKEFPAGWEREIETWRRDGYLSEPVSGRRRWFLDGENMNEIVNFPIQGAGASLIAKSMIALRERIKPDMWGPFTGINNQCHDSLMIETLPEHAEWVAKTLEECMNQTHPGLPGVTISATAAIGRTWKDV